MARQLMTTQVRTVAALLAVLMCALLAACVGPTVYQPNGATGGYRDKQLGENRYLVEFFGNGFTSKETVWRYWINRCAELTQQKGFAYFTVLPKDKTGAAEAPLGWMADDQDAGEDGGLAEMKGGAGSYVYVPTYYGGGGQITKWSSSGTVLMFKSPDEPGAAYSLKASVVLESLKKFIATEGREGAIASEDLIQRAMASSIPAPDAASQTPWANRGAKVELKDLDALLPR